MPSSTLAAPKAALLVLVLAVTTALAPLAVPAHAAPMESWDPTRQVAGLQSRMGGDGQMIAIAEWVDTSPDLDHREARLRVKLSTDDGTTFATLPDAPDPVAAASVSSVLVDATRTAVTVVSRTDPGTRVDRYTASDGWSSLPDVTGTTGCVQSGGHIAARRGSTVLLADHCLQIWRSTDNGHSFSSVEPVPLGDAQHRPTAGRLPELALAPTADGFFLGFVGRTSGGYSRLYASASTDDGASFSPARLISAVAHENVLSLSAAHDATRGVLAVAADVAEHTGDRHPPLRVQVHRSTDGGVTFSAPVTAYRGGSRDGTTPGHPLLVATDAGFDVSSLTWSSAGGNPKWIRRQSADGGATWTPTAPPPGLHVDHMSAVGGRQVHLLRRGYFDRTNDNPAAVPHQVPSVSVNPFIVKFGQTANVTITGTPGATVDLYIRKYLGDFLKIRNGLVLDSSGRTTVATRPDMNLRFMAKDRTLTEGSSIGGTSGLMTVEKQVSINAKRVGVNRVTFTGSINPMHPGSVVHLYRNGTLIKANIPVNNSRIYSFTGTLPAGTASYRITSPTTGYNNVSHSPVRSIRIS